MSATSLARVLRRALCDCQDCQRQRCQACPHHCKARIDQQQCQRRRGDQGRGLQNWWQTSGDPILQSGHVASQPQHQIATPASGKPLRRCIHRVAIQCLADGDGLILPQPFRQQAHAHAQPGQRQRRPGDQPQGKPRDRAGLKAGEGEPGSGHARHQ
jgi:hypothetical protein